MAGITLNFEPLGRQSEIALYTLNKSMEVTYNMATRRNYPVRLPKGECILNAVALAVLAFAYLSNAEIFRENYRKIIGLLLENIWSPQFYGTLTNTNKKTIKWLRIQAS